MHTEKRVLCLLIALLLPACGGPMEDEVLLGAAQEPEQGVPAAVLVKGG